MKPILAIPGTALALCCFVLAGQTAPINYPNHAYVLAGESLSPLPGGFNVKAVAIEGDHVLAVTRDGRVLGGGQPDDVLASITNAVAVGLNYTMGAVLTADGRVIEIGGGQFQPPGLTNVIAIDVSGQFFDDDLDYKLAVTSDGRVVTWGRYDEWFPPSADVPGVATAAGGWNHIVALKNDGTVVQWGMDGEVEPIVGLGNVVAIAAGGTHSVALKTDGTVVAWGENYFDQLDVPAGLSNVVAISAAEYQTIALKADGTLVTWGQAYFGGNATVPTNLPRVMAIAISGSHSIAICEAPKPPPITYPNQAYLFYGTTVYPIPGLTNLKAVAVEGSQVLGVSREGVVIGPGGAPSTLVSNAVDVGLSYARSAALTSDGTVVDFNLFELWPQPPGLTNVIAFDVFGQMNDDDLDATLAVTADGRIAVWGQGAFPPPENLDLTGVISASGGWAHVVAVKSDGTVIAWGDNSHGQLNVPHGLSNAVAVTAGANHCVALRSDGTVVAWGESLLGQLDVPQDLFDVVAISASEYQTLALKRDGTLVAWGSGEYEPTITPPASLANVLAIDTSGRGNVALVALPPIQPSLAIGPGASHLGELILKLSGEPNQVYTIETSTELKNWSFARYVTNQIASTLFSVEKINANHQFFRARRQ